IKKRKSKDLIDPNFISNSNPNSCPEDAINTSNNDTSDETLSDDNISTSSNSDSDTEYTSKKLRTKTKLRKNENKKSPNGQHECGQLVKTQGSTDNFQSHLNTHRITKLIQKNSTTPQLTINEMFQRTVKQNSRQKESIERALPLHVLQSESFIKLIHILNPYYELPSNKQVKAQIHQSYNYSTEHLKTLFATELKTYSLTCDLWTARSKSGYIEIMCHFVNSNYELKEIIFLANDEKSYRHTISDVTTCWNSSYIAWKRLLQIKHAIKLMEVTMNADSDSNVRKDANRLKSMMITEDEWIVLKELTMLLAPFAEITELQGVVSTNAEEIDLMDTSDVFDDIEEENIIDLDKESATITTIDGSKIKLNQPQNTNSLVNKVKEKLYMALKYYWNIPTNSSLIATLLDPRCKSMKQLKNQERDKAISLLKENYELLNTENKDIGLPNEEPNQDQMSLFSIMFGLDSTLVENEVDRYLKIEQ
ncbi:31365_t:CDS:2, partial [Racocetra persica]